MMNSVLARRVRRGGAVLAAVGTVLLTGGTAVAGTPVQTPPVANGCRTTASAGSATISVPSGGQPRTVVVHVPTGHRVHDRTPLVINLHGSGSSAAQQEQFSGMNATADERGFLVAYPQALIPQQIGPLSGYDWNVPGDLLFGGAPVPPTAPDDAAFVAALPGVLAHDYCVDPSRVYLTGFSGGARLTSYLACHASDVFAAVAPVAGLRRPTPCPAARAVPVIGFHGTVDPVDPFAGHSQQYWTYSVPQAARSWATQDRCAPVPRTTSGTGEVRTSYRGCAGRAEVQLDAITGEGHEWPGGPTLPAAITSVLVPQSDAVDADSVMWTFFLRHPMPCAGRG